MKKIKKSLMTQYIGQYEIDRSKNDIHLPQAGDVAVFEVIKIGKHKRMQEPSGKNRNLYPGDWVLAPFGNRYATGQFEGYVPSKPQETYHILGQGGAIGILKTTHSRWLNVGPTELKLVGYAVDAGKKVINTRFYNTPYTEFTKSLHSKARIILSVGSSMDSGKTTTAGYLAKGLKNAGHTVNYLKLTGTVYSKDKDFVEDLGADRVLDFSDFGFPSTYKCHIRELLDIFASAMVELEKNNPDFTIIEIADGLYQRETEILLNHPLFMAHVDHIIFSCGDSMGVPTGVQILEATCGNRLFAVAGLFTASPLLISEVHQKINLPILNLESLQDAIILDALLQEDLDIAV